tara:strand:- start:7 stop:129 length:123 start_codon:yes stop_codon:yes gene_type:complete
MPRTVKTVVTGPKKLIQIRLHSWVDALDRLGTGQDELNTD